MTRFDAAIVAAAVAMSIQGAHASTSCSQNTLAGDYAVHGSGWTGTVAPFDPVSVAGIRTFDGAGDFHGSGYEVGAGTPQATTTAGTYVVDPNCTVTLTFTNTPGSANQTQYGVATNDGDSVFVTRLNSGYTVTVTYTRVTPR